MAEPLLLAKYHDAVTAALKNIEWVRDADAYPERNVPHFSGLTTPAVYFTINSWEQGGGNEGQLNVELSCDLFIVVDSSGAGITRPEIFLRTAAADITQWIDGQQFGMTQIEPAVFIDAARDEFDPRMDDYLVWRISFTQGAAFGSDPFVRTSNSLSTAWLGVSPDIGRQHVDDYQLIYEAKPDE